MDFLKKYFFTLLVVIFITPQSVNAEVYKWVDEKGKVHFSDTKPETAEVEAVDIGPIVNSYTSPKITFLPELPNLETARKKQVVMYSASWCGVCKTARKYFQNNNIKFKEYDVDTSEKGKKDFKKLNGRGVPIILVGRQRLNGFNVSSFKSVFGR